MWRSYGINWVGQTISGVFLYVLQFFLRISLFQFVCVFSLCVKFVCFFYVSVRLRASDVSLRLRVYVVSWFRTICAFCMR
eukprot:SAG11_NODE_1856_length_4162_cov_4.778981_4_plen_80_part_00